MFLTGFLSEVRQPLRLPGVDPGQNAVAQILAVGVDVDAARPLERFQGGDRRHHLHAVVGGVEFAALELLLAVAEGEDGAPAAGTGIAGAGAVGVNDDVRQRFALRSLGSRRDHSVIARARDFLMEAQLAHIFHRVLRPHQRAGRHVEPIDEPREQKAQRGAARQQRQLLPFRRARAAARARSWPAAPGPW